MDVLVGMIQASVVAIASVCTMVNVMTIMNTVSIVTSGVMEHALCMYHIRKCLKNNNQ
jgi:hypothetical protein